MLSIETVAEEMGLASPGAGSRGRAAGSANPIFTMKALQDLASRIQCSDSLESLVDSMLEGLEASFGFRHSMILVPSEEDGVLVTIATRGYAHNGVGAEVRIGQGIAGMVAEARKPIRISGLLRGMLYGVTSFDWRTLTGVAVTLTVVVLLASFWPARRAASVDPLIAIRTD